MGTPHTNQGSTEETKIEEAAQQSDTNKSEEKKAPGIALPITEMTDDWMDDGEALGSMDSEEEEEELKVAAEGEKGVQEKKSESEIQEPTQTTDGKSATDNLVKAKTT